MANGVNINVSIQIAAVHQSLDDQCGICFAQCFQRIGILHFSSADTATACPRLDKYRECQSTVFNRRHRGGIVAPSVRRWDAMRGEVLIHFELVKAEFCCLRIGCKHLYADFLKVRAILRKQFNFRVNQCCNGIDLLFAADIKNRIQICRVIYARNEVMPIRHI